MFLKFNPLKVVTTLAMTLIATLLGSITTKAVAASSSNNGVEAMEMRLSNIREQLQEKTESEELNHPLVDSSLEDDEVLTAWSSWYNWNNWTNSTY